MEDQQHAPSDGERLIARYEELRRKRERLATEVERVRTTLSAIERALRLEAKE